MATSVITPEISTLVHGCEQVTKAMWEYNTREERSCLLENVEQALQEFRDAAKAALHREEVIEPSGTQKMLTYVTTHMDDEKFREKTEGLSILFQEMRLKLQQTFCGLEKPIIPEFVPADRKKLRNYSNICMNRYCLDAFVKVGEDMCNPLLTKDKIMEHIIQDRGYVVLGVNGYGGDIASYALAKTEKNGVHFKELKATPYYEDTAARHYLLKGFDWSIPHNTLQGMERYLTTPPIDIRHTKETGFFATHDFIAFGGTRDKHGELTHVRLGKLTDEFRTWGTL